MRHFLSKYNREGKVNFSERSTTKSGVSDKGTLFGIGKQSLEMEVFLKIIFEYF